MKRKRVTKKKDSEPNLWLYIWMGMVGGMAMYETSWFPPFVESFSRDFRPFIWAGFAGLVVVLSWLYFLVLKLLITKVVFRKKEVKQVEAA